MNISLIKLNLKININDIISNHKDIETISIDNIEVCSSLIDEVILPKIKKINKEEKINIFKKTLKASHTQNLPKKILKIL